ncbi:hypothetical protein Slin15195_G130600 [Septoria linicola]|uniref:Uncharacterized protein n=1 Tax=Septoria linicola TaxID=215465 RepID=A0A9Q9BB89_9PEZI|nr:hypothetical protein Slin15195_G130600 [Septoria linicola]
MATEYTVAKAALAALLAERSDDRARQSLCEQQIRNKIVLHSAQGWQIFCAWEWLEQHDRLRAEGFRQSLALPEQLTTCVFGCGETLRREHAARRAVDLAWADWDWTFGTYTPLKFSIGLLEKLAMLARMTPGEGWMIAGELGRRVRTRLQTTSSTIRSLQPRDVESVVEEIRRSRLPRGDDRPAAAAAASAGHAGSRVSRGSIELGRAEGRPLSDRSSGVVDLAFPRRSSSLDLLDQLELDLSRSPPRRPSGNRNPRGRRSLHDRIRTMIEREARRETRDNRRTVAQASADWRERHEEAWLDALPDHWK